MASPDPVQAPRANCEGVLDPLDRNRPTYRGRGYSRMELGAEGAEAENTPPFELAALPKCFPSFELGSWPNAARPSKKPRRPGLIVYGASRTRTGDLLGAIQALALLESDPFPG